MKKILLFVLFNFFLIPTLLGCGCGREKFSQEAYDKYELIFIGRLIETEFYQIDGYQGLTFEVIEVLKGQTTKIVKGKNMANTCSFSFSRDQEWIIYSAPEYGSINDQHLCGLSTLLKDEHGESVIGKPDHLSTQKWQYELNYLRERKSKQDKIVSFQISSLTPRFSDHISYYFPCRFYYYRRESKILYSKHSTCQHCRGYFGSSISVFYFSA